MKRIVLILLFIQSYYCCAGNSALYNYFFNQLNAHLDQIELIQDGVVFFQLNDKKEVINIRINIKKKNKAYGLLRDAFLKTPLYLIKLGNVGLEYTYKLVILNAHNKGVTVNKEMSFLYAAPPVVMNCQKIETYNQISECININLKNIIAKDFLEHKPLLPLISPKQLNVFLRIDSLGGIKVEKSNIRNTQVENVIRETLENTNLPLIRKTITNESKDKSFALKLKLYASLITSGFYREPSYDDLNKNNRLIFRNKITEHFKRHVKFSYVPFKTIDKVNFVEGYYFAGSNYVSGRINSNNPETTLEKQLGGSNTYITKQLKNAFSKLPKGSLSIDTINKNFDYYIKFVNNFGYNDISIINCNPEITYKSPIYLNGTITKRSELRVFLKRKILRYIDKSKNYTKIHLTIAPKGKIDILHLKAEGDTQIDTLELENKLNNDSRININYLYSSNFKNLFFSLKLNE